MANGKIKFFSASKGFGFIARAEGEPDLFIHISALERAGYTAHDAATDTAITFEVGKSKKDDRPCAENVSLPGTEPHASKAPRAAAAKKDKGDPTAAKKRADDGKPALAIGTVTIGTVSFFSDKKGFGFLTPADPNAAEVFLHIKDVPEDDYPHYPVGGDTLPFRVVEHNGRPKAEVLRRAEAFELGLVGSSSAPAEYEPLAVAKVAAPVVAKAAPKPKPKPASVKPPAPSRKDRLAAAGKMLASA